MAGALPAGPPPGPDSPNLTNLGSNRWLTRDNWSLQVDAPAMLRCRDHLLVLAFVLPDPATMAGFLSAEHPQPKDSVGFGDLLYTLEKIPPSSGVSTEELMKLETWLDHELKERCYMLASMSNELQRRFEETGYAADIHLHLKELYGENSRAKRFTMVKNLMTGRVTPQNP
ncbi:guanosine nucleotide diphosphate dissociation inhibitor 2-like [Dorcoceras hygrometricum]|uniref:Guanosine nucleotide diphosphate dissociation inhibitor 2-like n=1 Tax=Dorcoceras hygrometricum TaxID=472368 RepID=A0A2Z7ARP1_9LAMI|nr:guanosine nucleotide diphosphate dissociation inhibitor 2-like [Dorcoceras hygrometricum]